MMKSSLRKDSSILYTLDIPTRSCGLKMTRNPIVNIFEKDTHMEKYQRVAQSTNTDGMQASSPNNDMEVGNFILDGLNKASDDMLLSSVMILTRELHESSFPRAKKIVPCGCRAMIGQGAGGGRTEKPMLKERNATTSLGLRGTACQRLGVWLSLWSNPVEDVTTSTLGMPLLYDVMLFTKQKVSLIAVRENLARPSAALLPPKEGVILLVFSHGPSEWFYGSLHRTKVVDDPSMND